MGIEEGTFKKKFVGILMVSQFEIGCRVVLLRFKMRAERTEKCSPSPLVMYNYTMGVYV